VKSFRFTQLHLLPGTREPSHNSSRASDGISLWFGLGLLLLGDRSYLIEIASEDSSVWDVLGRFRKLQQDDPSADNEKSHNHGDNGSWGPFKSSK
jgi:hypothetical protein